MLCVEVLLPVLLQIAVVVRDHAMLLLYVVMAQVSVTLDLVLLIIMAVMPAVVLLHLPVVALSLPTLQHVIIHLLAQLPTGISSQTVPMLVPANINV